MRNMWLGAAALVVAAAPALAAPGPLSQVNVDVIEDAQPVRDVLRRLEERHGLNYVVSEQVLARAGTVTVRLKQVPLDVALESICAAAGLSCELRGPVIVIIPRGEARSADRTTQAPLPEVREGVVREPGGGRDRDQTSDAGAPPPAQQDEPLQAVGRLEEVDTENGRIQLRIDGTKVDFYLPEAGGADPAMQGTRLRSAVASLRPGSRVALLYRREEGRSVISDLIGGTRPPRARRPQPAGMPRDQVEGETPAATPAPAAEGAQNQLEVPEGALAGKFVAREGEAVRIKLGDGSVVELQLPPAQEGSDRRQRVQGAIDALRPDDQILVTYEEANGARVITNTITSSR
jgi:hypothetical protein